MSDLHKRLNIAYITATHPDDRRAWSGTTYYMAQALQKHCGEVHHLGPITSPELRFARLLYKLSQRLLKKQYLSIYSLFVAKKHAKLIARQLAKQSYDVVFAPIGEREVAFLDTDLPIVIATDTT